MINFLIGKIKNIDEKSATILTISGVGYKVFFPLNTLLSFQENLEIESFIYTNVKDDAIDLYGFLEKNEMKAFEKLISVSGVGPKSALNVLSVSSLTNLAIAIENNDANLLIRIPGLGKKTCEKICLELKGKFSEFINHKSKNLKDNILIEENDARLALLSLGYNEKDINNVIEKLKEKYQEDFEKKKVNEILKEGLKLLR